MNSPILWLAVGKIVALRSEMPVATVYVSTKTLARILRRKIPVARSITSTAL
jgi:hypothetical protein